MIEREEFIRKMDERGITSGWVVWKRASSLVNRGYTSPDQITREAFPNASCVTLSVYRNALRRLNEAMVV